MQHCPKLEILGITSWLEIDSPCLHRSHVFHPIRRVPQNHFPGFAHHLRWQAGSFSVHVLRKDSLARSFTACTKKAPASLWVSGPTVLLVKPAQLRLRATNKSLLSEKKCLLSDASCLTVLTPRLRLCACWGGTVSKQVSCYSLFSCFIWILHV